MDFPRYGDWSPTQFDSNIDIDRSDWLVMPVMQTRDSGPLDQSNFACFLDALGGEGETVEVRRFGHWGPGWFEIIIIDPNDVAAQSVAYDCARALQDYPVLNDTDHSIRESEAEMESWSTWAYKDFSRECEKLLQGQADEFSGEPADPQQRWCKNWGMDVDICGCGDCIETVDEWMADLISKLDSLDTDKLYTLAKEFCGMEVEHHSDGPYFKYKIELQGLIDGLDAIQVAGPAR